MPHGGPFRYATKAWSYLDSAREHTTAQLKQGVISASALSLLYPQNGITGYSREAFLEDLVSEATEEIRGCVDRGAIVQIDFTEARLSLKLDPSGGLLDSFVELNNRVLAGLTDEQRARVGVHTCPGGDQDSTHSADVDYAELLPGLFRLDVGAVGRVAVAARAGVDADPAALLARRGAARTRLLSSTKAWRSSSTGRASPRACLR